MVCDWLRARPLLWHWLPLLSWMALIFFLSAQADLPHPESGLAGLFVSSSAHVLVFAVLAVLWARVFSALGWHRPLLLAFVATFLYALSDEFHQSFVPGRHTDAWDLLCDATGALLALGLWALWQRDRTGDRVSPPARELEH